MIKAFLIRRWWLTQNRLLSTVAFALVFPVVLHVSVNLVLKHIIVRSLNQIPYETWVFPGLALIMSVMTIIPLLYRDLFDLRIHKNSLVSISLAPISKQKIIGSILLTAMVESLVFTIIGMMVLSVLMNITISAISYLILIIFIILFLFLFGNLYILLSLLTERSTLFILITFSLFFYLLFGSEFIVEFEFYPGTVGKVLQYLPTGIIVRYMRLAIFSNIYDIGIMLYPIVFSVVLLFINAELFRRKLHQ